MKRKYVELWVAVDGTEFTSEEECEKYEKEKGFTHEYDVEIHFFGTFFTTVEAKNKEEALSLAREEMQDSTLDWEEDKTFVDLAD